MPNQNPTLRTPISSGYDDELEWYVWEIAPGQPPFDVTEARQHLKLPIEQPTDPDEDAEIGRKVMAATQTLEHRMERSIQIRRTLELQQREVRDQRMWLPYPPYLEVDLVQYVDTGGNVVVVPEEEYVVTGYSQTRQAVLQFRNPVPQAAPIESAWLVRYKAGYEIEGAPEDIKEGVKLTMDILFDNDLDESNTKALWFTVDMLTAPHNPGLYR